MFLVFFIAFIGTGLGFALYGLKEGDPAKLLAPYDGTRQHHFCGYDYGFENHPLLYLTSLAGTDPPAMFKSGVCV